MSLSNTFTCLIYFLFLVICGSSCVEEIKMPLPSTPSRLVLNGLISPDSLLRVQVSQSTPILDPDISTTRFIYAFSRFLLCIALPHKKAASLLVTRH